MKHKMECVAAVFIILVLASIVKGSGTAHVYIDPADVASVTRVGGLPGMRFAAISAGQDDARIQKIVGMINRSTGMRTPAQMEAWSHIHGYPVDVVLKLKNGETVYLQRVMDVTVLPGGFTGRNSTDRFMITFERDDNDTRYILYSSELPGYIVKGADADIPRI
jgi:hypothetical protein